MYDQINEFDLPARNSIGEQREDEGGIQGRTLINEEISALNQIFFCIKQAGSGRREVRGCKKGLSCFSNFIAISRR